MKSFPVSGNVREKQPLDELLSYLPVLLRAQSSRVLAEQIINVASVLVKDLMFSGLLLLDENNGKPTLISQHNQQTLTSSQNEKLLQALPVNFLEPHYFTSYTASQLNGARAYFTNINQLVVAPCRTPIRSFGYLLIGSDRELNSGELRYMEALANLAAIALDNAFRFDDLREAAHEMSLVNEMAISLAGSLNVEELFNSFIAHIQKIVEVDRAELVLLVANGQEYTIPFSWLAQNGHSQRSYVRLLPGLDNPFEKIFETQEITVGIWETAKLPGELVNAEIEYASQMLIPLVAKKQYIGVVALRAQNSGSYSQANIGFSLLDKMAGLFALALLNSRLYEEKLLSAEFDNRIGVYNHDYFDRELITQIHKAQRNNYQLGLVMADMDSLKQINDKHGHLAGDAALRHVANLITRTVRATDIVTRYGGDEFAVILPGCTQLGLEIVAEKTLQILRTNPLILEDGTELTVTVSIGAAIYPHDGTSPRTLVEKADGALYVAKRYRNHARIGAEARLPRVTENDLKANEGMEQTIAPAVTADLNSEKMLEWLNRGNSSSDVVVRELHERLQTTRFELKELTKRTARLEENYRNAYRLVAALIEHREPYLAGNSEKIAELAVEIGQRAGLNQTALAELSMAGWLANLYRLALPESFWNKPEKFSATERAQIEQTPLKIANLLNRYNLNLPEAAFLAIQHQHERFDGKGYPQHLANEEIPLGARILGLVSAFVAMQEHRPYKQKLDLSASCHQLEQEAGKQFEPQLVIYLLDILKKQAKQL